MTDRVPVSFTWPDEVTASPPPKRTRRLPSRRVMLWTSVTVVVLAVAGAIAGWFRYADTYAPLGPGFYQAADSSAFRITTDGLGRTGYLLSTPRGAPGRVTYTVWNTGAHDVRLLGLDPSIEFSPGLVSAKWAPTETPDGAAGGEPDQVRTFPVTVPAGHQVAVWVWFRKPVCGEPESGFKVTQIPLRWSALGFHHVYALALRPYDIPPVWLCYPKDALRHVER